ncbi:MAG: RNase H family protein [Aureliella sp.]
MVFAKPHYLLFCDAHVSDGAAGGTAFVGGRWHFVLERIDINERLEAADSERAQPRDRLALLAVVRGLEAIEMPSQVTLVTTSRYVSRGLRYGLSEWREANYSWEHFGMQKPIRNADLWQRIDRALQYHEVACRLLESTLAQRAISPAACAEEAFEASSEYQSPSGYEAPSDCEAPAPQYLPQPAIPAPHFLGQRRGGRAAASVARVERPGSAAPPSAWWPLAAGWMQWWRGRAVRPSLLAGV